MKTTEPNTRQISIAGCPCTVEDDRTPEQLRTHNLAVVARDKFLSGWGGARGGNSRCAWAMPPEFHHDGRAERLERWVRNRSEMRNVNVVNLDTYRPPAGTVHFHIYVADASHPGIVAMPSIQPYVKRRFAEPTDTR